MEYFIDVIKNGEIHQNFYTYICSRCAEDIPESAPMYRDETDAYCPECAFISGAIDHDELMRLTYWLPKGCFHAEIIKGEVVFKTGSKPKAKNDRRGSAKYKSWRTDVFKRDKHTCQECHVVGGELNAHHIKPYALYKRLRYSLKNGITLCEKCHKREHSNA